MVTKHFIARIQGAAAAADTLEGTQTLKSELRNPKNASSLKGPQTKMFRRTDSTAALFMQPVVNQVIVVWVLLGFSSPIQPPYNPRCSLITKKESLLCGQKGDGYHSW